MSVFAYKVFAAIVEEKSFGKAARVMNITPSAISHCISRLEEQLGLTLFTRDRTGAELTEDGKRLLPLMRDVLKSDERLQQEAALTKGLETGAVCIGMFNSVCIEYIPELARTFREKHPNIEINICQGGYDDILGWLRNNVVDMAFASLTDYGDNQAVPLFRDRMMCVTHKSFKPRNPGYVTPEDIRGQKIVYQCDGDNVDVNACLAEHGITISSRFSVDSDHAMITLVEADLGMCIIPELVYKPFKGEFAVYPLEPAAYRTVVLATPKNRPLSAAAREMHEHIISMLKVI